MDENSKTSRFEPSNSRIVNIKKMYNFEFIKSKYQILEGALMKVANKLNRWLNCSQASKAFFAKKK